MSAIERRLRAALATEADSWPDPDSVGSRSVSLRRRRLVPVVAVAALVSVAAGWWVTRGVTNPTAVVCYREASLDSDRVGLGSEGSLSEALCAPEWESGPLVNEAVAPAGEVPSLIGCVTDEGVLAVFPSADQGLCGQLGLAVPDEASLDEGDRVRRLTDSLVDHFAAQHCRPLGEAEQDVRRILDDLGFEQWEIRSTAGQADRPCASFGIDPEARTIHLVPIPRL